MEEWEEAGTKAWSSREMPLEQVLRKVQWGVLCNRVRQEYSNHKEVLRQFQRLKLSLGVESGKDSTCSTAAQRQLQLRAFLVATLDKGDLAAIEASGAGDLLAAAASLPAAVWSALAAAAAALAVVASTDTFDFGCCRPA